MKKEIHIINPWWVQLGFCSKLKQKFTWSYFTWLYFVFRVLGITLLLAGMFLPDLVWVSASGYKARAMGSLSVWTSGISYVQWSHTDCTFNSTWTPFKCAITHTKGQEGSVPSSWSKSNHSSREIVCWSRFFRETEWIGYFCLYLCLYPHIHLQLYLSIYLPIEINLL